MWFSRGASSQSIRALAAISSLAAVTPSRKELSHCDEPSDSDRIVFLGTGSSQGCPRPACPLLYSKKATSTLPPDLQNMRDVLENHCRVSNLAMEGDPKTNKNYRNNPSLLISFTPKSGEYAGRKTHVIIDVGKTFREGALRWLPDNGVACIDAIILTHHHMDASAGLDDVRGFQHWVSSLEGKQRRAPPMPLFLSQHCYEDLQERFPWCLPKKAPVPVETNKPVVHRHVASFDVNVFEEFRPMDVKGLRVVPLPVLHGEDLISFGFAFTVGNKNILYLSDISRMLPETMKYIQEKLPATDVLVIDSLHPTRPNSVHYTMNEAISLARQIKPKIVYMVGMNCDSFAPHEEMNKSLLRIHGHVQMAHDGLVVEC